jgi:hypothetical protein
VPEGLSPSEAGKEIAEHHKKATETEEEQEGGSGAEISGHFRVRAARPGLIGIGGVILVFSSVLLILAPKPPV